MSAEAVSLAQQKAIWIRGCAAASTSDLTKAANLAHETNPHFNVIMLNELEGRCLTSLIKNEERMESAARNLTIMRQAGWENSPEWDELQAMWEHAADRVAHFTIKLRNTKDWKRHYEFVAGGSIIEHD